MRSRPGFRRRTPAARGLLALVVAGTALVALCAPASASGGASDPPGWTGATAGEWVAFTVSPTTANPVGRSGAYEPVTITRDLHLGATSLDTAFGGWPMRDTDGDSVPDERGWPEVWSDGSVTLTRVAWCVATATQCAYQVTDPGPFHFAGGDPVDANGAVDYSVFPGIQTIQKSAPPELNIVFSWNPATARTPTDGTNPGKLTLDASGSSDQFPGTLVFEWTVTRASDSKTFTASPNAVAQFDLDADDVYCVSLKVTNTADSFSKTYGVGGTDCQYVDKVAPQAPAGNGGGGGGVGGIPTSGNAGAPTVVFAPPRRTRSALTGRGPGVDSSVVWLWRPEWYQPTTETQTLPQTTGSPLLKDRRDIVVSSTKAPTSDAGPWLAGLGAFGLIGIGWVLNKRRRVRAEY